MPPRPNLLKPELRAAYISSQLFFTTIFLVAVISGGSVYLLQKEIIKQAIQDKQDKQNLMAEVLRLREQIAKNEKNNNIKNTENGTTNATSTPKTEEKFSYGYKYYPPTSTTATPYFLSATDNKNIIAFDKKIYVAMKKNGETMAGIYCPENPFNLDIIYFATYKKTPRLANKIYSYNTASKEIKTIFENDNGKIIKILGITGNKLAVTSITNETPLGKCMSIYAGHEETPYFYLDINNTKNGLKPYIMPQEQTDGGRVEEQNCLGKK